MFLFTFFFSLSLIFTLVAASTSHFFTAATKFHVVPPTKNVSFVFFYLALALFLVELRWPVSLLSLFPKFVDMTINLNSIQYIQKHFPLSVFIFIRDFKISEFKIRRLRTTTTDKHATTHDQNHVTVRFSRVVLRLR